MDVQQAVRLAFFVTLAVLCLGIVVRFWIADVLREQR